MTSKSAWSCIFLCALPVFGQTLRVSSVSAAPGQKISVDISLDSAAGEAPATLKWEAVFPAELLEPESSGPTVGSAAKDAGKSLTCARRQAYSYVCILAGGQKPIANGPIAVLRFQIRAEARSGTSTVRIEQVEAVTKDLKTLKLSGVEGQVVIR